MRLWKVCEIMSIDVHLRDAIENCRMITDALWINWARKPFETTVLCLSALLAKSGHTLEWANDQIAANQAQLVAVSEVMLGLEDEVFKKIVAEVTFGVYSVRHAYPTDEFKNASRSGNKFRTAVEKAEETFRSPKKQRSVLKELGEVENEKMLLTLEGRKKFKWVSRLREIMLRAGEASGMNDSHLDLLNEGDAQEIKELVLGAGAPSTIKGHVRAWERLEQWAEDDHASDLLYPPSPALMLAYAIHLHRQECGPSVIPALRSSVKWICRRLAMPTPDLNSVEFNAIEERVIVERGEEIRKTIPFPMDVVKKLERAVMKYREGRPALAYYCWIVLLMTYGSLRFDDMLHVKMSSLEWKDGVLFGSAWQTKVERKRRGTKFAVPAVSLSDKKWLEAGFDLFKSLVTFDYDFMIFNCNSWDELLMEPASYNRFVSLMQKAVFIACAKPVEEALTEADCLEFKGHTPRVTMINAGSHAGADPLAQMAQANWASLSMPIEYTRQTKSLAVSMIHSLVKKVKKGWRPGMSSSTGSSACPAICDNDPQSSDEGEEELQFFVRKSGHMKEETLKYHVQSSNEPEFVACKVRGLSIRNCEPVGSAVPDPKMICDTCRRKRPELFD